MGWHLWEMVKHLGVRLDQSKIAKRSGFEESAKEEPGRGFLRILVCLFGVVLHLEYGLADCLTDGIDNLGINRIS